MSVWRFDLFSEEKPALFASTPPIVCTRPCISANSTRLGTITMRGLCCCTFIGSRSHHLAPCFSTLSLSLDSRSLSWFSVFIRPALAHLPPNPEIQKEMSLQLGKEEDAARSSFRSGETWHDKRRGGKHSTVVTFTSTSEFSATELPALCLPPPHESFPVMLSLNTQTSIRSAHPLLILHCFWPAWALDTESWETWESEHAGQPKLPTSLLDKLHCCLCCCGALSRSGRREGTNTSRRDNCQVQIWVLGLWCNGR